MFTPRIRGRDVAELAKRIYANMVVVFARDAFGYTYYRGSGIGPMRPSLRGDFLRELLEEAHRHGIRVVAMVAHTTNKLLYMKHTEWAQKNLRGEPVLLEHAPAETAWEPEWPLLCPNSPFLEHAAKEVSEVVGLGVDGIFFDSFRYQPDPEKACYCEWCQAKFREEHGYDMPTKPDWDNRLWRTLWDWRYSVVVRALQRLAKEAKKTSKEIHVMYNSHPGGWAGRTNRVVEMARGILDGVFAECSEADFEPPGFIAEMVKLTRAMAGPGVKVYASRNAFHSLKPTQPAPPPLIRQGLREAIIAGGEPWVLVFSSMLATTKSFIEPVEQVFREHEKLEEYLAGAEPLRFAAIVISNTVRDHYGRLEPSKYVDETRGFYYSLLQSHIPVEYLLDKDVSSMSKYYKVLILADTACTDSELLNALRSHLEEGGTIIATHQTSLYDGECLPAGGLLASNILGVELLGEPMTLEWAYIEPTKPGFFGIEEPLLVGDNPRDMRKPLHLASLVPVTSLDDREVPLQIRLPAYRYGHEYTLGRSSPPPGPRTELPALVLGKRVAYYPWRLGANYWATGNPVYRNLIVRTLEALGGEPPLHIGAPITVLAEPWRQKDRVIVHLLNYTANQRILATGFTGAKQPLPSYSSGPPIHPVTEIIPVHDIEIRIDPSLFGYKRIKAYSALDKRTKLETRINNNKIIIKISRLKEYDVIVVEPEA
ncbi:hypothetical protein PYJP_16800 [Pyrofollis japonicus]|nr:hypothetical protein PYJP_16800 [Pyrofollis japonicus]